MDESYPALHRAILGVDIERFADRRRTNPDQMAVRAGLYRCLRAAFARSGMAWESCYHEDRGDGALILVPPEIPKAVLVTRFLEELSTALRSHNDDHAAESRMRVRLVVHAGEVHQDGYGVAGTAVTVAFRLLETTALKQALANSPGPVALIASRWFFEEVIRHTPASDPATYRQVRVSVKETDELAWIRLPDRSYSPGASRVLADGAASGGVPHQLPAAIGCFAGRSKEMQNLAAVLDDASAATMVISAVDGMPGIGKTTLAVHWAHQVAHRFPDGQLYVNLRGFDPGGLPVPAAEAICGFLNALGIPADQIPKSLDAQAALYRSLLAGRRVLVVLDNARDVEQVRPLLPGSAGCLVLITSRNQLTGLIATGAHVLTLDLPTDAEAHQLLERRLGSDRLMAEPGPARQMVKLCGRLPLALSIVAARAMTHPHFSLTDVAAELQKSREHLDAFEGGDPSVNARAVFSWSYQQLSEAAARIFRILGLHPGPDITVPATASMAGVPVPEARSALVELARSHLVTEHVPGRFTFHDLLRTYAIEQAEIYEPSPERDSCVRRVLDHYLHTAYSSALMLHPRRSLITPGSPQAEVVPEKMRSYAQAWSWFEAEDRVLLAMVQLAAATGADTHAWQIPWTLVDFHRRRGYWQDWVAAHQTALAAAQRSADKQGEAHALRGLGRALSRLSRTNEAYAGQSNEARTCLAGALALFEELDDIPGQAFTHIDLCWEFDKEGTHDGLAHAHKALLLARSSGHIQAQARALNTIAWRCKRRGDYETAIQYGEESLALSLETGDRRGEADTLHVLGDAHLGLGHRDAAAVILKKSLALHRELGERYGQAQILTHVGETQHAAGDTASARATLQQALDILNEIGLGRTRDEYPNADHIRALLARLAVIEDAS
jgi:tetratricopeptide (TPR) repeat protein